MNGKNLFVALSGSLFLALTAFASELRRPDGWTELPRKQRAPVWEFSLVYEAAAEVIPGFKNIRISILPVLDAHDLDNHLAKPYREIRKERVLSRLQPDEVQRVVMLTSLGKKMNKKPKSAIMTSEPFADHVHAALATELEALGFVVVAPAITHPAAPEHLRDALDAMLESDRSDFIINVRIDDLFAHKYARGAYPSTTGIYFPFWWADISFELSVTVFASSTGESVWSGTCRVRETRELPSVAGGIMVDAEVVALKGSFLNLIHKVVRNNRELKDRLRQSLERG